MPRIAAILAALAASLTFAALPAPAAAAAPESDILWGACPAYPGGSSASAAQRVVDKWGQGVHIRQFTNASSSLPWNGVPDGSLMHRSYKPPTTITDAAIDALLRAAEGHYVTFWHESENDGLSTSQRNARINLMNRLYERNVALGRPATVVPTFTGWMFAANNSNGARLRDQWDGVKGDLLGVDYDGIHSYSTEYDDETENVMRWLADNPEYRGWAIPEFGTSRRPSDPTGAGRLAWMQEQVGYFLDAPILPETVDWFDYNTGSHDTVSEGLNSLQPGSPEYVYWRGLVSLN
jgi:hypothetical protein